MTSIYIAGPMSGLPDYNYPAFLDAEGKLTVAGYHVLNPARVEEDNPTPGTPQEWGWYMRRCLKMVADADGIALLDGWRNSRGATLERLVGISLGMDVHTLAAWIEPHERELT